MRLGPHNPYEPRRVFAWLPVQIRGGPWVWLEWVEKRKAFSYYIYDWPGTWISD